MAEPKTHLIPVSVIKTIDKHRMLERGERVLIALSGGPDSVALAHILKLHSERYGIHLHLAYLNHNLRGDESIDEQQFVERVANDLKLPLETRALMRDEAAEIAARSTEARARETRLQFLSEAAERVGASKIATGHTLDDQVETLIMRLFIGTGPAGFSGIRPVSGKFIRPLIDTPKSDLLNFLEENSIEYIHDSTNRSLRFLRNKVRHVLLPKIIETFGPGAQDRLLSFSNIVSSESDFLEGIAERALREAAISEGESPALDILALNRLEPAIRNRVLRLALSDAGFPPQSITSRHIEAVSAIARSKNPNARTKLPGGVSVARRDDIIVIGESEASTMGSVGFRLQISVPGEAAISSLGRTVSIQQVDPPISVIPSDSSKALLDAGFCLKCGYSLLIRNPEEDDRFTPLGMDREMSIIEFLKKQGLRRDGRMCQPVLARPDGELLWVIGVRIAEQAKMKDGERPGLLCSLGEAV
ncbi:MAG: tRNA lysidine(34) synthetase TilS [Candidatus Coatesbacteria bacterium]|nr:tRNA lysidine(34) synthetase TilS [Candidatus Coatesbacteria bacterium]